MQQQQGHADLNGTQLYYQITGSGSPLVLIHGFSMEAPDRFNKLVLNFLAKHLA